MSTVSRGNSAERFVARWLEERGWLVASRRHIGGAADLLAVHPDDGATWLIEVKCAKELWQQFRRGDRLAMKETPLPAGGERWVVNKRGSELEWLPESAWP